MSTQRGHVRLLVRYTALQLLRFTVDQMVRKTKCDPGSVKTQLRRMIAEGLVAVVGNQKTEQRRGLRKRYEYRVVAPDKIVDSLSKFRLALSMLENPSPVPVFFGKWFDKKVVYFGMPWPTLQEVVEAAKRSFPHVSLDQLIVEATVSLGDRGPDYGIKLREREEGEN